jgi:hypothetical protein
MARHIEGIYAASADGEFIVRELTSASTTAAATVDTAMTLAYATVDGYHYSPGQVLASYSDATPSTGKVSVTDYAGTTTYWAVDIEATGAAPFDWDAIMLPVSTGMKITIAAGGGSSKARISAAPYRIKGNGQ